MKRSADGACLQSSSKALPIEAADNVLENQKVITLIQEGNAIERTIGVITRCDGIEETNEEKACVNINCSFLYSLIVA